MKSSLHVLLITRDDVCAQAIEDTLADSPHVQLAREVETDPALNGLSQNSAHVALIDIDTIDFSLGDARENGASAIPVVALTSRDDETLGLEMVRAGAQDCLVKGRLDSETLYRRLRFAAERHAYRHVGLEKALLASEERFRQVFQEAAIGMCVTDVDGRFLRANAAYCRMLGYTEDELRALDFSTITYVDDREKSVEEARLLRAEKQTSYVLEKRYIAKSGTIVWARISVAGLRDASGKITEHIVVCEDITRRKQAEIDLEHSQALLRTASRVSRLGGWAVDLPDYTLTWSDEVGAIHDTPLGFVPPLEDAINYYAPEYRATIRAAFTACVEHGTPYDLELEIITAQGWRVWVRTTGEAVRDEQGSIMRVQGAFQDISERKAAEQSLRESEERFRLISKATNDAIWDWNLATEQVWWNEGFEALFGYDRDEIEPDSRSWSNRIHPDDRDEVLQDIHAVIAGSGANWQREYRFVCKNGGIAYVLDRGFVMRNEDGQAVRMVGSMIDLTGRKHLEAQMLRAQRMESLGILAGGIAHDLNNVLTPILLSAFLLKKNVQGEQARKQLEILEATAARGAEMVRQVLTFARGSDGLQVAVAVDEIAQEVLQFMQDTLDRNIEISLNIVDSPWAVTSDPTQIHQVLMNLCVNARDAMPQGGKLSIEIANVQIDEQYVSMAADVSPGPYVCLSVADSGMGIPKHIQERIFEPFFTTKGIGEGTGLGLSTVQGIIQGYGGFIRFYSEERRGTTFKVYLPARSATLTDDQTESPTPIPLGEGELILVVDDEKSLREMTQQTLETFGYRVVVAEDGAEALTHYVRHQDEMALVLTDMMMPVMDGYATTQALRKINPDVKIIAASGLGDASMVAQAARAGVTHFLPKPYTAETLLNALAQVLGKA